MSVRDSDVNSFMRRLKIVIAIGFLAVAVPLMIYAINMDQRLDAFEDALRYRPLSEQGVRIEGDVGMGVLSPVQGQVVYVPAYSHVYHQDGRPHLLTITLSVRNTSMDHPIVVKSVRYFDTRGKEIKSYLNAPIRLSSLATTEFVIERDDIAGGSGANFLVEWIAEQPTSVPVIEAVMIDTTGQQGISFVRSGVVIKEDKPIVGIEGAPSSSDAKRESSP